TLLTKTEDCNLTQVKIDEVLCLVCNIAAKISAHDTMPATALLAHLLDIGSNVLLYVVLLHSLRGAVNSILLHVLRHVCILDHCLPVRHRDTAEEAERTAEYSWG
uniref:Dynein light chain n=2 Tax=Equus TaxID=9789 RepID=A0A9L0SAH1_HORSE